MQDGWDCWEGPYEDEVVEIELDAMATTVFTSNGHERDWHHTAPFHDLSVYAVRKRNERNVCHRHLSADDLRDMRDWDLACYFGDREYGCAEHGCEAWYDEHGDGEHVNCCPWSQVIGDELEAHGLELHRRVPTFWERLRKLGATPEVVAEANAILHPKAPTAHHSTPSRPLPCASRRRTGTRSRGRRAAPSRRITATRGSPSDDDGPSPPPPGLKLWRHPHFGAVSPNMLRLLLEEAKR